MQIEVDCRQGRVEKTVDEAHCAGKEGLKKRSMKRIAHFKLFLASALHFLKVRLPRVFQA